MAVVTVWLEETDCQAVVNVGKSMKAVAIIRRQCRSQKSNRTCRSKHMQSLIAVVIVSVEAMAEVEQVLRQRFLHDSTKPQIIGSMVTSHQDSPSREFYSVPTPSSACMDCVVHICLGFSSSKSPNVRSRGLVTQRPFLIFSTTGLTAKKNQSTCVCKVLWLGAKCSR